MQQDTEARPQRLSLEATRQRVLPHRKGDDLARAERHADDLCKQFAPKVYRLWYDWGQHHPVRDAIRDLRKLVDELNRDIESDAFNSPGGGGPSGMNLPPPCQNRVDCELAASRALLLLGLRDGQGAADRIMATVQPILDGRSHRGA